MKSNFTLLFRLIIKIEWIRKLIRPEKILLKKLFKPCAIDAPNVQYLALKDIHSKMRRSTNISIYPYCINKAMEELGYIRTYVPQKDERLYCVITSI